MTDPLETDLRAMLIERAGGVTPDPTLGEAAIARRLDAGDTAVAQVISVDPARRRGWLVAAALLLVCAVGAATFVAAQDQGPDVRTGPAAAPPRGRVAILEFRPVMTMGPCEEMGSSAYDAPALDGTCFALGDVLLGNSLIARAGVFATFSEVGEPVDGGGTVNTPAEEAFGVALTFTDDGIRQFNALASQCFARVPLCPTGQLAIVVDGDVLSAPTVQQPEFEADQIQISGDFTEQEAEELAAALQPRPGSREIAEQAQEQRERAREEAAARSSRRDPTLGEPGDSAKDVAERAALRLFGEEYVTTSTAEDGSIELVTMDGLGGSIVAEVAREGDDGTPRVLLIHPVAGPDHLVASTGSLSFDLPEPGDLTYTLYDDRFVELSGGTMPDLQGGKVGFVGPVDAHPRWVAIRLETPDGRTLVWLEPLGD